MFKLPHKHFLNLGPREPKENPRTQGEHANARPETHLLLMFPICVCPLDVCQGGQSLSFRIKGSQGHLWFCVRHEILASPGNSH